MAGKSCSASLHMLGMSMELCEMLKVEEKKKGLKSFRCFFVGLNLLPLRKHSYSVHSAAIFNGIPC